MDSIFLSASIPLPKRAGYDTADPLLIHVAIRSFLTLTLGRRRIVFGGHPSITPMVVAACHNFGLDYFDCVSLYQSRFFQRQFPVDNNHFDNLTLVPAANDREASLKKLREQIFEENDFTGAVFIGGMEGVEAEFDTLKAMQPNTILVPVYSAGGVAAKLALRDQNLPDPDDLANDYTTVFAEKLNIDTLEERLTQTNIKPPKP